MALPFLRHPAGLSTLRLPPNNGAEHSVACQSATHGQLAYEWKWLLQKLRKRSPALYRQHVAVSAPAAHPACRFVVGPIAEQERIRKIGSQLK